MTRVEEQREAQRIAEQRRLEDQDKAKQRAASDQFAKVVGQKQEAARQTAAGDAQRRQKGHGQSAAGEKSKAQSALLARQGIQSRNLAKTLHTQGEASGEKVRAGYTARRDDHHETTNKAEEKQVKADNERLVKQQDKLAPISRDDKREQKGGFGGKQSGAGEGAMDLGGKAQQAMGTGAPVKSSEAQGSGAPTMPPEVIRELVSRVFAGVTPEGLSQFTIELNPSVLSGARLDVVAKDGKITCTFHTDDKNVGRLLKASEGQLARAFAQKGLTLEQLAVAQS